MAKNVLSTKPIGGVGNALKDSLTSFSKTSKQSGGGSAPSGGGGAPAVDYAQQLESTTQRLYESTFKPDPVNYTALTGEALKMQIAAWLRPGYDQAIVNRRERTKTYQAELDADAIARGMGASTYVTDVKSRQQKEEARDVALLESEYGATLAESLAESLDKQQQRALDVDMFNAEQEQAAYDMAYDAALALIAVGAGGKSGTGRRRSGGSSGSSGSAAYTSRENIESFLSILSNDERAAVYAGSGEMNAAYKQEIVSSVGVGGYFELMNKYSSLP